MASTEASDNASVDATAKLYQMGRGATASMRLSFQHHLLTQRQGWLLAPPISADIKSKPNLHILDMATGNGIWALDVGREYPHAHVSAMDVTGSQFPVAWSVPENITFGLFDLFDEIPDHLTSKFDVIHIRYLLMGCPTLKPQHVLDGMRKMLKPGGWFQWVELQRDIMVEVGTDLKQAGETLPLCSYGKSLGMWAPIADVPSMDQWFESAGFLNVVKQTPPFSKHLLKMDTDNTCCAVAEFAEGIRQRMGGEIAAKFDDLVGRMQARAGEGLVYGVDYSVVVGQKPSV